MVIRCERCSTLYELDEALLAPEGSQVQCTRCDHVFTAFPARAPGRTLVGVPAAVAPPPPPALEATVAPEAPEAAPSRTVSEPSPVSPPAATREDRPAAFEPRVSRSVPPPVYRPAVSPPPGGRASLLRRDAVGTFESRLRRSARWKWLAPSIAAAVLVAAVGGWLALRRHGDPAAERARAEGLALVALDDADSLDQALSRFDDALRRSPRLRVAVADRALAQLLRASALEEEVGHAAARMRERSEERERLEREQPAGWEELKASAVEEIARLEPEVRALEERSRAMAQAAHEALRALEPELADDPAVARALAARYALGGERDRALRVVRTAREAGRVDPWLDVAEATLDLRAGESAGRERAIAKLGPVVAKHPELLRARYLLARAEAALGRRSEASAAASAILSANPRHEGASRLRDALAAPLAPFVPEPTQDAAPAPAPATLPPAARAENATPPQRKPVTQPATAASAPAPGSLAPAPPATSAPASATRSPAAAEAQRSPRPSPLAPNAPSALPVREGALAPATIPEADAASGAPLVTPPEVRKDVPRSRAAYQEEAPGGG